jgi:broad-specificity NMP kinase
MNQRYKLHIFATNASTAGVGKSTLCQDIEIFHISYVYNVEFKTAEKK